MEFEIGAAKPTGVDYHQPACAGFAVRGVVTLMLNAMTFLQHLHAPPPGYAVFADGGLLVQL
jgi:hypothetical protein